jgi:hypothetical protein
MGESSASEPKKIPKHIPDDVETANDTLDQLEPDLATDTIIITTPIDAQVTRDLNTQIPADIQKELDEADEADGH